MTETDIRPHFKSRLLGAAKWGCVCTAILWSTSSRAADRRSELIVEGFTEPYRTVDVAAPDSGIVDQVLVQEGDVVKLGQVLATLDQELHLAQLAIAQETAATKGKFQAVQSELALRRERVTKLEQLARQGHARSEEVERARGDVRLGEAELLSATEDQLLKKLELERAKVMLDRRRITAKINGVIVKVHKDSGEFVAANDPVIATLVQLDPLRLSLSVPRNHAVQLKQQQKLPIRFLATDVQPTAEVERISPLTDAESNTVTVQIRIENAEGLYRAGDRCELDLRALAQEPTELPRSKRPQGITNQSTPPALPAQAATN